MTKNVTDIYNEGYYYFYGKNGYPLNYRKALECFKNAAELGNSEAMNYLGLIYEDGKIVGKNLKNATEWYLKAVKADTKNANALYNLGRMYYNGTGISKDVEKAYQFFMIVLKMEETVSKELLAKNCFMIGCIMLEHFQNKIEAYPYFEKAAVYGDIPDAWYNLGWLCEKGVGKNCNSRKAYEFYKIAVVKGCVPAMDAMGRILLTVNQMEEGRYWIKQAADRGYDLAKKRLKMLDVGQSGSIIDLLK